MTTAFLIQHAAQAYRVDHALVLKAFQLADPFPLPQSFLTETGCTIGDTQRPEHNAYLTARWVASLKAEGKSDNEVLDAMTSAASVPWKAPLSYRLKRWVKALIR